MEVKFAIPKNFTAPEGIREGEEFKMLSTYRLEKGKLCLTAIGDGSLNDDDETEDYASVVARKSKDL